MSLFNKLSPPTDRQLTATLERHREDILDVRWSGGRPIFIVLRAEARAKLRCLEDIFEGVLFAWEEPA